MLIRPTTKGKAGHGTSALNRLKEDLCTENICMLARSTILSIRRDEESGNTMKKDMTDNDDHRVKHDIQNMNGFIQNRSPHRLYTELCYRARAHTYTM